MRGDGRFSQTWSHIAFDCLYRIRRIIGKVFNLAVWQIIFNPPNLNDTISGIWLLCLLTTTAFRQIKVTPTTIFDRFAKYLTRQIFCIYGITESAANQMHHRIILPLVPGF